MTSHLSVFPYYSISWGRKRRRQAKEGRRDGSTFLRLAQLSLVFAVCSLPSPTPRASPRICWCLRCFLCAEGRETRHTRSVCLTRNSQHCCDKPSVTAKLVWHAWEAAQFDTRIHATSQRLITRAGWRVFNPLIRTCSMKFTPRGNKFCLSVTASDTVSSYANIVKHMWIIFIVTCSNGLLVLIPFPPTKIQLSRKPTLLMDELPRSAINFLASSLSL